MCRKKALLVSTVSGFVPKFEMNNVGILKSLGYEIHYATNYNNPVYGDNTCLAGKGIIQHQIDFDRSPFNVRKNLLAYFQLKDVIRKNEYDLIHCHTPVGGVLTRLAVRRLRKVGYETKLIYTAHGFHFFKGASLLNWLMFYPVERELYKDTDILITINNEDYQYSEHWKKGTNSKNYYIPGVGIDLDSFSTKDKNYNLDIVSGIDKIKKDDFLLISVGELSYRKNHLVVLKALKMIKNDKIKYLICGSGKLYNKLHKYVVENQLAEKVIFLGYRNDVYELLNGSNLFVFPSKQEGLPVALMEAMASGLPIICSKIRGNIDLIDDGIGGIIINNENPRDYAEAIIKMFNMNNDERERIKSHNKRKIENFSLEKVEALMKEIYK